MHNSRQNLRSFTDRRSAVVAPTRDRIFTGFGFTSLIWRELFHVLMTARATRERRCRIELREITLR
jgi:hypothetical protein